MLKKLAFHISIMAFALFANISVRAEVAVIVHPANTAQIDKTAIKKIFLGKVKKFSDGKVAIPMNAAKGSPVRDEFNNSVIGRSTSQVNAYWSKLLFTGKGIMPKELSSDAEIIATVSDNQGAIAYVPASAVTDNVKVVATF